METLRVVGTTAGLHSSKPGLFLPQSSRSLAARTASSNAFVRFQMSTLPPRTARACSSSTAFPRKQENFLERVGSFASLPDRSFSVTTRAAAEESSDVNVEGATQKLEQQAESKAAYSAAVDALKQEILKVQESAKEAYEPTAEKAIEVLKDTTDKLKAEAEKARARLTSTAAETAELGKSNLNLLAENAPDPIKDIAETAVNAHLKENIRQGSKIHDFCLGIPYGILQVIGGLLWFIITGSTDAIRFGVVLGGILLALSVTSLRVWKQGNSSIPYIQGQAAVAFIIFVKDSRKLLESGGFPRAILTFASFGILAFYAYVYLSGGNPPKKNTVTNPDAIAK